MDDEEILSINPGDKLDHLVAKMVMDDMERNYSKDLLSAWSVVKKIEEENWRIDIMSSKDTENVGGVKIVNGRPISLSFLSRNVECDNIEEALCKAALLIVNNSKKIYEMK